MRKLYTLSIVLVLSFGISAMVMGQNVPTAVSLGASQSVFNKLKATSQSNARVVSEIDLVISSTKSLKGKVNFKKSSGTREYIIGEIQGVKDASFLIDATATSLEGHIVMVNTKKAYKYFSDESGNAFVEEVDINKILCIDFNPTPVSETKSKSLRVEAIANAPETFTLQSLPGAAGCIYLDFDGETVSGTPWKGGATIVAAPANMSDAAIVETWELVSEDYRPFNINVTTNRAVFNSYPKNRRMMHISTTSKDVTTTGVAYIGSFNWNDDTPCWGTYTSAGKICGEVASHEVGHTFDLGHDGRSNPDEGYYGGAGNWAPIMGNSYTKPITTFSKGEYARANNLQDDLATISGSKFGVGYRNDAVGNNTGSAKALVIAANGSVSSAQNNGIIERTSDLDFFSFTTGGGNITLNVNTVSRHGDLDVLVRLYNQAGTQIGSYNPDGLNATVTASLGAGTYYISVDGTGYGNPNNGYSDYASLGSYFISGTIPPGNTTPSTTGLVTTYKDINYTGFSGGFSVGDYNLAALKALGVDDNSITSLKVTEGYKIILYFDDNFTGQSMTITSDNNYVGGTFNDQVTSLRVRPNGATNLGGIYTVQNRNSGKNMDVWGGSTANGSNIAQANASTTNINQQFTLTHLGDGLYKIIANVSGKSLDINNFSTADGANVEQYTYNATNNQQFILFPTGDGYYKIIPKHSGKVVEVAGYSTESGGNVQQWTNVNQNSGHWNFSPLIVANGNGDGLTGNYFNGMNFETPVYTRKDATVSFDWGNGSPNAAVNADRFSIRWTGQIQPKYSGVYTFYSTNDDGDRLWINNQLIIDKWANDGGTEYSGQITLTAGQKYDIKFEFFENGGGAKAKLEWSHASQTREVIPQSQLYSNALPSVSITSPANNVNFNATANITVNANASDNGSVAKVEFYNGTAKIGEDNSSPYSIAWNNVGIGTYTLTTRATDNQGAVSVSSSITVKVNQTTTTNQAPTVSLTSPANNANYNAPASISIAVNASDADGSVTKVEFYNGTTKIGEDASSPYSFTWSNVVAGTYTISAKAIDNNNASTNSGSVTVKVNAVVANDPCSNLAAYTENNGYVAGSKVKNAAKQYECKEWPYSGWCNGASWAYAPGTGAYWQDAWYEKGSCNARSSADINTISATESFFISPNPVEDELTINSSFSLSGATLTIIDVTGKTVYQSVASESLSTSSLDAGIYTLIFISSDNNKITKRFVKIK